MKFRTNPWVIFTIFIALMVSIPILVVFGHIFYGSSEVWEHLYSTVLKGYIINSLILMLGVGISTIVIGVSTAWVVTMYQFPGRKIFEWSLILPLAMPAYIVAIAYSGMLDYTGPIQSFLREYFGWNAGAYRFFDIMSIEGVILVMSFVLYPYVYLIARASFRQQSASVLEVSQSLGQTPLQTFLKVALPLARPAIVGGVSLALMEVLSDFGTVQYYGVDTFTTGIFRAWFSLGDENAATKLATMLMLFVLALIVFERVQRGRAKFDFGSSQYRPVKVYTLGKTQAFTAFSVCFIPLFFGFLLPVTQLMYWSFLTAKEVINREFVSLLTNSFLLAVVASILSVVIALLIAYAVRLYRTYSLRTVSRVATSGYSIPGVVVALGVMIPFAWFDNTLNNFMSRNFAISTGLLLSGTLFAVIFAYIVRFLAVPFNSIEAGLERISRKVDDASRSLGATPVKTLFLINLPLIKGTLLAAAILVFVDVLKELPLTLILRPFNFDTLAIKAFELAHDEMVPESANAALVIIAAGIIPVIILSRLISTGKKH